MTSGWYDFTDYQVLVVGGTRGQGHAIATAFAESGAYVTVTGTMMLRPRYADDLSAFEYESVNLARQDSIDHLVSAVQHVDVLVLAAGCNLPHDLPGSERDFITEATRLGLLGPTFLTTRLRLKLSNSPADGGGCVVNTDAVRSWFELASTPDEARAEVVASTRRAGEKWEGLGVRVNSVVRSPRAVVPRQYAPTSGAGTARVAGDTLVRTRQSTTDAVTDATLFLASRGASRITGQTLHLA